MYHSDYRKHNKWPIIKIALVVVSFFLLFIVFGLIREVYGRKQINSQVTELEQQIKDIKRRNGELSGLIDQWQSGDKFEQEARIKLGLQKPGEKVVLITSSYQESGSNELYQSTGDKITADRNDPFYINAQKWWLYFFANKKIKNN